MKITVVVRQVPDLIEPIEIASSLTAVDFDGATFVTNESDDQALEQALLIKEKSEASVVTVVALDFGDVDNTLFTSSAKGADQIIKIDYDGDQAPAPWEAAAIFAPVIRDLASDLVLVGSYAHDELEGSLAPLLARLLEMPYVGVVCGVEPAAEGTAATVCKEFPNATMARLRVQLPAVLGIVGADQPPRYVPVSRIRAAMKTAQCDQRESSLPAAGNRVNVERLYLPESGARAQILDGSEEDVVSAIVDVLRQKGVVK